MNSLKVTMLGLRFLSNENILKELAYWLHVMKRPQGWHYDMDETWMLENLEQAKLPKGATILDAGAGLGVMQFVLAARGYNVVSLDFTKRAIPKEANGIFDVILDNQEDFEYKHSYQKFIVHSAGSVSGEDIPPAPTLLDKFMAPNLLPRLFYKTKREVLHFIFRTIEKFKSNKQYGTITFVRGAFHEIPFGDNHFDALVSVSALEHADIDMLDKNISEMVRVVKPDAPILISTSAIGDEKDFFDVKSQGWCFSSATMSRFADNTVDEYAKCKDIEREILSSSVWQASLDSCYFLEANGHFYKKNISRLPYFPIGISR